MCTTTMPRVRRVIFRWTSAGSISPLSASTSAKTGTAPWCRMQPVVAPHEYGEVMTSSPGAMLQPATAQ